MTQKKAIFIAAGVALLISVIIVGIIMYLNNFLRRSRTPSPTPAAVITSSPSPTTGPNPIVQPTPSPQTGTRPVQSNEKIHSLFGINVYYPQQWGLLKCNNSANFELDPTNPTDQVGVACDFSVKPITVLVSDSLSCSGQTVRMGNVNVTKSQITTQSGVNYRWCLTGQKSLDITHRVSSTGGRATSNQDYSAQIEEMISKFTISGTGGS